jgi:hypothetical protein
MCSDGNCAYKEGGSGVLADYILYVTAVETAQCEGATKAYAGASKPHFVRLFRPAGSTSLYRVWQHLTLSRMAASHFIAYGSISLEVADLF